MTFDVATYKVIPASSRRSTAAPPAAGSASSSAAAAAAAAHSSTNQGIVTRQFYPQRSAAARGSIRGLMLLQNDLHIATLGADSVVQLFNRFTLTLENAIKCQHDFDVNAMAFTQSGEMLVTCRYKYALMYAEPLPPP